MSTDGTALERMVTGIEKVLLGEEFTVVPNYKVFDDDGNQVAEFDIRIEGKVGSTSFRWLIECRDRPSEGPAPSSWIQQLAGRKELFGFDKVIAVSTTGFSRAAKDAARRLNITLRMVTSSQELSSEFGVIEFRMSSLNVSLRGYADFDFPPHVYAEAMAISRASGSPLKDPKIRLAGENDFLTLSQFIQRDLLYDQMAGRPQTDATLDTTFEKQAHMELRWGERILKIVGMGVPVSLEYSFRPSRVLTVKSYEEGGTQIGEEIAFSTEMPNVVVRSVVLIMRKNGETYIVRNASNQIIPK